MKSILIREYFHRPFECYQSQATKHLLGYCSNFKLREILSECASLITEYVLNLSKFLIQWRALVINPNFPPITEHKLIIVNKVLLKELNYLNEYNKWDGNHGIDEDKISKKYDNGIHRCRVNGPVNVIIRLPVLVPEHPVADRSHDAEQYLDDEDYTQNVIHIFLHLRHLQCDWRLLFFHYLCVPSRVDDQPVNQLCVL